MDKFDSMTDEDWDEVAQGFVDYMQQFDERDRVVQQLADGMDNKTLYEHLIDILTNRNGSFWDYKDDVELELVVTRKFKDVLLAKRKSHGLEEEELVDLNKLTIEQSKMFMFAKSAIYPFTLDGKHYVTFEVYGQGESFQVINGVDKEATYINVFLNLDFIKGG